MKETDKTLENDLEKGDFFEFIIPSKREGQRLDHYLVEMIPDISRSRLTSLIQKRYTLVNGNSSKAGTRLKTGDRVAVTLPPPEPFNIVPEKVDFNVLFEDKHILVVAKPPGIVVHPACGHHEGTLVHGLLAHCDNLSGISGVERPGIVHRLDKDTSGVMVVAKNDKAHNGLVEIFKSRQIKKVYHAIIAGRPESRKGCISQPIGRHRNNRKKMAVLKNGGRDAVTCWTILEEFADKMTYLEIRPETGRTHQIRVHMAHLGHPVVGDVLYGSKQLKTINENYCVARQCLHAYSLAFKHPVTGEQLKFTSPVWPDMQKVLERLRR